MEKEKTGSNELMYVDIQLNRRATRAMVDTCTTYNFISEVEARWLGLMLVKDSSKIKAVNSITHPITGQAKSVISRLELGRGRSFG